MRWIPLLALIAAGLTGLFLSLGDLEGPEPSVQSPGAVAPAAPPPAPAPIDDAGPATPRAPAGGNRVAADQSLGAIEVTVVDAQGAPMARVGLVSLDLARADGWRERWEDPRDRERFMRKNGRQWSTDEAGKALIPGAAEGAILCQARGLSGFLTWSEPPEDNALRLVMSPERSLEVIVQDHRGRPKTGVRVGIVREAAGHATTLLTRQTIGRGKATFGMVQRVLGGQVGGGARFYATLAFPCEDPPRVQLDPADLPEEPIVLVMPQVGSLEVRVLDERGRPLSETANVTLGHMTRTAQGGETFIPEHNDRLMNGVASFAHVGVGTRVAIKLSGSRERADLVEEFDGPSRGGEVHRVQMKWTERYPVLLGTAVGEGGELLKGFRGRYMVWSGERGSGGPPLTVGPDGSFRLVVASTLTPEAERYVELELYPKAPYEPQYARIDLSGPLAPGETNLGTITFRPKPKLVTGTVRNAAGEALTGVHLRVMVGTGSDRRSTTMAATSLQGGAFTIYGDVREEFGLVAVRRGFKNAEVTGLAPGTTGIELTLFPELPQAPRRR